VASCPAWLWIRCDIYRAEGRGGEQCVCMCETTVRSRQMSTWRVSAHNSRGNSSRAEMTVRHKSSFRGNSTCITTTTTRSVGKVPPYRRTSVSQSSLFIFHSLVSFALLPSLPSISVISSGHLSPTNRVQPQRYQTDLILKLFLLPLVGVFEEL
jgi:hypothetical protein